ncbi:MAG: Tim44/TimA family putative adaptor protein [Pseudomonadota bacterium]
MGDNDLIILIGLAAVAGFLLLRLRNVLGERGGFEDHERIRRAKEAGAQSSAEGSNGVVTPMPQRPQSDQDDDIFAYAEPNSELGQALRSIKETDPSFEVGGFMDGAKGAYELILTAFENGDKKGLKPYLEKEVYDAFADAIDQREAQGLSVEMRFVGFRSAEPIEASLDQGSRKAEVSVRFNAEVVTATRNESGEVVEGDPSAVRRITDVWTFGKIVPSRDPVWLLVATGG